VEKKDMTIARFAIAGGLALLGLLAPSAHAQTVRTHYQNTFDARELGTVWSTNTRLSIAGSPLTTFNGNYSNSFTRLTLPAAGRPTNVAGTPLLFNLYTVTFDLYLFDSWDGNEPVYGVDRFKVLVNASEKFNETFSNHVGGSQSFRSPDVSGSNLGVAGWRDSIYRGVSVTFADPGTSTLAIQWQDGGLQGVSDESWGIDNVKVTYQVVPSPGPASCLLAGLGLLAGRRRR
jgi:hypothetical protein